MGAPEWSFLGGLAVAICSAALSPLLYFFLDKEVFATWVTCIAWFTLWCFPESIQSLLVTTGLKSPIGSLSNNSKGLLAVSLTFGAIFLVIQTCWLMSLHTPTSIVRALAPQIILFLGIPLRFLIAEKRGVLQAAGRWQLLATANSAATITLNVAIVTVAWFMGSSIAMAGTYFAILCAQALFYSRISGIRCSPHEELMDHALQPRFVAVIALAIGPLIFSQGDKILLSYTLKNSALAEYAFCSAVAGQISMLSALPCIPLAAWANTNPGHRDTLLRAALRWNSLIIFMCLSGLVAVVIYGRNYLPEVMQAKMHPRELIFMAVIYSAVAFNAPAYFLLLGLRKFSALGSVVILASSASLLAIVALSLSYGLTGAIMGNIVYGVTVLLIIPAYKAISLPVARLLFIRQGVFAFAILVAALILGATIS